MNPGIPDTPTWEAIAADISRASDRTGRCTSVDPVAGGCIHAAWRVRHPSGTWLVKTHDAAGLPLFEAEADGLEALRRAGALAVPAPLTFGRDDRCAWLVLEWLDLVPARGALGAALGHGLALQHGVTGPHFGWHRDNFLGTTPQPNGPMPDWAGFFRDRRLAFQIDLAEHRGHGGAWIDRARRLLERVPALLADRVPEPSLLHGDLWSGNAAALRDGRGAVYDPAVHFGDREADLAMTELFGGFDDAFYRAYDAVWPREAGYAERRDLYQLYHVLNHLNLFGNSYAAQTSRLIDRLLSRC